MMKTKPHRGSVPEPDHILLSICGDAKTTMAVSWRTDCTVADGWAEVRPVSESSLQPQSPSGSGNAGT